MDLSLMLNNGSESETEKRYPLQISPESKKNTTQYSVPPTPSANERPAGYASNQSTPLHGPRSAGTSLPQQTTGLTPLQTPSQGTPNAQYPFPHPPQSPSVQPPSQQYQTYGPYSATSTRAQPLNHSYQHPQASPSHHQAYAVPTSLHTSLSPTPSSHFGHTPQAVRQSPLSTAGYGPPQPPHQRSYQHSQPSTPLGPPPLQYRTSYPGYQELQSPHHQRHSSITSNGLTTGSPAQYHPSIGNLVDSPGGFQRHSPHIRRTSDYLSQVDRERSLSVSPKTRVLPRALSHSSRQSSHPEGYSANGRSSLQLRQSPASLARTPDHVTPPSYSPQSRVAHPQLLSVHSGGNESVAQTPSSSVQTQLQSSGQPALEHPLSQPNIVQPQPQPILPGAPQYQSQRLDLNHLLTPASSITSIEGAADGTMAKTRKLQEPSLFMKPSPKPKRPAVAPAPPQQQPSERISEDQSRAADSIASLERHVQHPAGAANAAAVKGPALPASAESDHQSHKRPAEHQPAVEPPAKRGKARKYTERPVWARLHPRNPAYRAEEHGVKGASAKRSLGQAPPQQQQNRNGLPAKPNGVAPAHPPQHQQAPSQPNGKRFSRRDYLPEGSDPDKPWSDSIPLDRDLLRTKHCLGLEKWERSIRWTAPMPEMLKQVIDWLYVQLSQIQDVPDNPEEVEVEIEAKIGKIVNVGNGERIMMPITSPTILNQMWATGDNIRFESQMELNEHKAMNAFLNTALQASKMEERYGRVPMDYSHPKSRDSFRPLSDTGYDALPPAFRRHASEKRKELKLRTTTNLATGEVEARIVKSKMADLHIFNPAGDYDCRISLNLEANMNLPHLAPYTDLFDEWAPGERASPDRMKDRMSYKHLVYRIDLTMVSVSKALPPKFELELEVEGQVLREQMRLMSGGEGEHAFADLVGGFLDNATFLMRQRAVA
ncbi:hypothetical protein LTR91_014055 [Friedmanniomyces endolithicus]|uniref:mRNA-capping enzyme subunit beta n=1 Tax=Friedmanniomyces endolithicus TaxID=329885 RepID=A0AAN6KCF9_9PEZI|nr:hypothetical protein LTR94_013181 [Friedmanniomyces endolithicus]KAK0783769.1 hypothetical protein LTR59_011655 [Friedmanniomyces endolithicus]KAK0791151.1 hypothetical protein LTR38_010344 [Friedmanniomyces endolithicus]KAK0803270.1 hypothetical protein LTR75_008026 [Friedmanniomyces endolithicus]KAK0842419.1 hypothetical protein LTR03_009301 [Friedmanniomyces endolithicus]